MTRRRVLALVLVLACALLAGGRRAAAQPDVAAERAFDRRWVVSMWAGAPAGIGYAVARTLGDAWRVRAAIGSPMLITGVGGAADLVRGVRVGRVTLWLGGTLAGYASDNCSWGGCGEYVSYLGAGPQAGLAVSTRFLGSTRLVADLGVGVAYAFSRTDNLARYQPLGGLHLGVGW